MSWISVEEKLPDESEDVLLLGYYDFGLEELIGYHQGGGEFVLTDYDCLVCPPHKVTHWQPLPEPPKED